MKKFLFWLGVGITVLAPLAIGLFGVKSGLVLPDAAESMPWLALLIGVFITLISRMDDIVELSLGPLKARMTEKIKEADAVVVQLQRIAAALAEVTLTDLMASNFMGGLPLKEKVDFRDRLVASLKTLGLSNSEIDDVEAMWRQGIGIIYHRAIGNAAAERTHPSKLGTKELSDEVINEAFQQFNKLIDIKSSWQSPLPAKYEEFLKEHNLLNDAAQAWIDDYRHYIEYGEIRRRDLFVSM